MEHAVGLSVQAVSQACTHLTLLHAFLCRRENGGNCDIKVSQHRVKTEPTCVLLSRVSSPHLERHC